MKNTSRHNPHKKWLVQILSWLTVLAILLFLLTTIVPKDQGQGATFIEKILLAFQILKTVLAHANIVGVFTLITTYFIYLVFFETVGTKWLITRFNCKISFMEMLPARAVTFIIAVFNYQAGQLAIPLYLKRVHKVPLTEGMGSIFFMAAMDLFIVISMGTIASFFIGDASLAGEIRLFGSIGMVGYLVNAFLWKRKNWLEWLALRFEKIPWLNKINSKKSIFNAFTQAKLKDYFTIFLYRLPIIIGLFVGFYVLIICYGERISLQVIFTYLPVIMILSTLPVINIAGLGATQGLVIYFFENYASRDTLFAVALTWALGINFAKVLFGRFYLTRISGDLFRPEEQAPE